MKTILPVTLAAVLLAACAGPGRYPLSRAVVGPDDPVHSFSVPQSLAGS